MSLVFKEVSCQGKGRLESLTPVRHDGSTAPCSAQLVGDLISQSKDENELHVFRLCYF